jgi:hypothetical protein
MFLSTFQDLWDPPYRRSDLPDEILYEAMKAEIRRKLRVV